MKFLGKISNNSPNKSIGNECIQDSWIMLTITIDCITLLLTTATATELEPRPT